MDGGIVNYDVVISNYGEAYNVDTSTFFTPYHGLYHFDLFQHNAAGVDTRLGIFINTETTPVCQADADLDGGEMSSCSALVELQAGDTVKVKGTVPGQIQDVSRTNGFTGFLYLYLE